LVEGRGIGWGPDRLGGAHRLLRDGAQHDLGYRSDVLADLVGDEIGDSLVVLTGAARVGCGRACRHPT
jgi:hypothetical protein